MDRSKVIFGNEISDKAYQKACRQTDKNRAQLGADSQTEYYFAPRPNAVLSDLGVQDLVLTDAPGEALPEKSVIVGNIRMGYGHYRISIAIASAAHSMGYTPCWLDLNGYPESTATKLISAQNDLYSLGSRLSQMSKLFNALVWDPLNSEGFRKLTYNAGDQKNAELMEPLLRHLPKDVPYLATHAWPAQAANHAGFERVVNVIPDNWPMALHLSEGSIHTVQTPSSFLGYKMLRGMDRKRILKPMPEGSLFYTGHYVDHELVSHIEADCTARLERLRSGAPRRYLLSIGGAGAQQKLMEDVIRHLLPQVKERKAALFINVGDHRNVWDSMLTHIPALHGMTESHFDDFAAAKEFLTDVGQLRGVQVFGDKNIFAAVYLTNLLLRHCDVLLTKPSELAYYPVPKIMLHRVGGHEAWGAIRSAEVGDGTYECARTGEVLAMMDEITFGNEILPMLCEGIRRANDAGIYNGAYEAVKLAVKQ